MIVLQEVAVGIIRILLLAKAVGSSNSTDED
jgi:hypothetical protein